MESKIIILSIAIAIIITLLLNGCTTNNIKITKDNEVIKSMEGHKVLFYDEETKIIYIRYSENLETYDKSGIAPYYSENGKLCRYNEETNTIEEVNKNED